MSAGIATAQERRLALVVGNGKYVNAPHLTKPVEDAQAIADALRRLGFTVLQSVDADRNAMERAIRDFGDQAKNADVAVFYYAGHAFQVSDRNLLIPTNASITEERDLNFETLDLEDILAQVEGRTKINIVLVDACRENPFAQRLNTGTRGVRAMVGPAPVSASAGTFIAFASAPGTVAEDGTGRNSPFTAAVLEQIETPGLEVRQMMGRVRQSVRETTQGRQIPWETSSLEGTFYFRPPQAETPRRDPAPPPTAAAPLPAPNREAELIFWESIKNSRQESEYQAYVERFPDGVFAPLARARMQQLAMLAPLPERGSNVEPASGEMVTVERTALRASPMSDSDIVGQLDAWTRFQATGRTRDGKWLRVRAQDSDAFLSASAAKTRDEAQSDEWRRAEAANTIESYAEYLERFPRDENTQLAGQRIDALRAEQVRSAVAAVPPPVTVEKFDATRISFVKAADRNRLRLYASVKGEKALALSADGEFAWATQMRSLEEAERIALERCEYVAGQPCGIYARNNEAHIPVGGEWKPDRPALAPSDLPFRADAVPFVTDAERKNLQKFADAKSPKALAVHPDGRHAFATGAANEYEAQQQALSRCRAGKRGACVLYADNNTVVLDKRSSRPVAQATVTSANFAPAPSSAREAPAPARTTAYDGVWRLRVDCGREASAFDVAVLNGTVNFGNRIKFSGIGVGTAFLNGSVQANGTGALRGTWNVERRRSVPAFTQPLSLFVTFSGVRAGGSASVGPRGPCQITGKRR